MHVAAFTQRARSVNGPVRVGGVRGGVVARTVNGAVETSDTGSAALRMHTVNGKIRVRGHAGEVRVRTVNGTVRLNLTKLTGAVRIKSVSGSATIKLPRASGASVDLSTLSGRLSSDLPLQTTRKGRRSLAGTLGQGGPQIRARTVSGSVILTAL